MSSATQPASQVTVVARSGCKYCLRAKDLLQQKGIPFEEVDVTDNVELLTLIRETSGHRTVPQIFVNGKFIGGSDELQQIEQDGTLASLLQSEAPSGLPAELRQKIAAYREQQDLKALVEQDEMDSTPAELLELNKRLQTIRHVAKSSKNFTYSAAFTGQDLLLWLDGVKGGDKTAVQETGTQLLQYGLVYPIKEESRGVFHFKRGGSTPQTSFVEDSSTAWYALKGGAVQVQPKAKGVALNTHYTWTKPARPAVQVSSRLRTLISTLYDQFLSKDGKGVSYTGMAASPLFQEYVDATAELQQVNLNDLSRDELLCFFVNLYNAIIVHATVVYGPPDSTLARAAFFTKWATYNVAGLDYSADDMEHGVLRGNKPPPSSLGAILGLPALASPQFKSSDPRSKKVVTPMDPRIHFALVCGAKSCPPIRVYEPDSLEEGLQGAAEAFCTSEVKVDQATNTVTTSMILKWYGGDFGSSKAERLEALVPYLSGQAKQDLQALIASQTDIKMEFTPYDWSVNSQ